MNSGIYCITNTITGKKYIGQSKNIKRRFNSHKRASVTKKKGECFYLQNAIGKHGIDNFTFEILLYATDRDYLNIMERKCIIEFDTLSPNGYNLDTGGYFNKTISESTRQKMNGRTPWNKGVPMSEEQKQKLSKMKKGKLAANKGVPASEEQKRKQSIAMKGKPAVNKGIPMSEEQKKKLRKADKSYTQTPEYRKKMSESLKKRVISPEHRAKINAGQRLRAELNRSRKGL